MATFTPLESTLGGLLIGASAALVLVAHGRVAGISGMVEGILGGGPEAPRRGAFLAGLLVGGIALGSLHPSGFVVDVVRSPVAIVAAGLLVGFGTRLGSGCTSGHGVCGVARLSPRSLSATLTFLATGAVTATVVTHVFGGVL